MTKPEIVVFDLGKVLVDFDYSLVADRLHQNGTIAIGDAVGKLEQSHLLIDFETGRIDNRQFFAAIRKVTGYSASFEQFSVEFGDIFSPIQEMIDWHARLKASGIPTCIFSNTNDLAVSHIWSAFPFFRTFDAYIYSHKVGAMKPDARIYEEVEEVTGKSGDAIFYLDDKGENIEGGVRRGWQTVVHRNPKETIEAAVATGLPG